MLRRGILNLKVKRASRDVNRNFFKWKVFEDVIKPTYILIPEVPVKDGKNYPLIDPRQKPSFQTLTADEMFRASSKVAIDYESKLGNLSEEFASGEAPVNFDYIIDRMEGFTYPVDNALNWCRLMFFLKDDLVRQMVFSSISKKINITKMEPWSSQPLKKAVDAVMEKEGDQLTEFDRGLLALYQRQFRLHGNTLSPKDKGRIMKCASNLLKLESNFKISVSATTQKFQQLVDARALSDAPPGFVERLMLKSGVSAKGSSAGVCKITLDDDVYPAFMAHCSDRHLRRNAWDAWVRRAGQSMHSAEQLSNHSTITEIRKERLHIAQTLGFRSHAELKVSGHMAGKVEPIIEMLDLYRLKYWERAENEMAQLLDFAKKESLAFDGPLQPWDISYWSTRYDRQHVSTDWNYVRQFFPLESVLSNSFELCRLWFGIEIVEAASGEVELPDPDVRFFHIKDLEQGGEVVGSFYLDPFKRPGKVTIPCMLPVVDQSEAYGCNPMAYFSLSLNSSSAGNVMNMEELGNFMHILGNGLQHLLTRVDHHEVAGQNGVPPDAVHICGHVFRRLLQCPVVLRALAKHKDTGERMPEDLVMAVTESRASIVALPLLEDLYHAAFDLEMWVSDEFWRDAQTRLWSEFMVVKEVLGDEWPCGASVIFAEGREATLYSTVWSTTVAGDIVNAFDDMDIDLSSTSVTAADMRPVMERFRSTFLSLGGAVPAAEVFRRFRGRDPVRTVDIL